MTPAPNAQALYFYRRSLGGRDSAELSVVYAVLPADGKPNPVPVVAGFPVGWRATENPGQCLADPASLESCFLTAVPRSQFRHYQPITEADALGLYPDLIR